MFRRSIRLSFLPVLLAAVALVGCERTELPGDASDPQFSTQRAAALRKVPAKAHAVEAASAGELIGSAGGSVELAGHVLIVPAGAVSHPTRFTLRLVDNGFVEVDLRAIRSSASGAGADVGKQGFARPVILHLSYELAATVGDPDDLIVAWARTDGALQPLRSSHDVEKRAITAALDHFSRYVLATP